MQRILKKIGQFFLDTIQAIVMALSVFIIVYLFLFQPHQVKGNSMLASFEDGEFLLTDKISYRFDPPARGDVVVFKAPKTEPCSEIECEYIKRIIGVPNDKIMVLGGEVYVNGQILKEDYLFSGTTTSSGFSLPEGKEIIVPENHYLVMGDNRSHSRDGREFGPIPKQSIIGKTFLRYWPVSKAVVIKHPSF